MNFSNRRVLITGSTRGIGRVTAERFLSLGARVAINGRSDAAVHQTIEEMGGGEQLVDASGDLSSLMPVKGLLSAPFLGWVALMFW